MKKIYTKQLAKINNVKDLELFCLTYMYSATLVTQIYIVSKKIIIHGKIAHNTIFLNGYMYM